MSGALQIRVLVRKEGDYWIAQCLEYDIGAQARDPNDLPRRLIAALVAEREQTLRRHGRAFAGIGEAPQDFFAAWERRAQQLFQSQHLQLPEDGAITIELGHTAAHDLAGIRGAASARKPH